MARKIVSVSLIVPDASPLITLGGIERLDILSLFTIPIHVVDIVAEEARRPLNDRNGAVGRWWNARPIHVQEESTLVGEGLRAQRSRGLKPPTGSLGEIAVDEYATRLARTADPNSIPLVLFEDPDVLELRIARLKNVHLLNTAGLLIGLKQLGVLEDADAVLAEINGLRKTPMLPVERPARTKRYQTSIADVVARREGREA